jgi:hypothetical protein
MVNWDSMVINPVKTVAGFHSKTSLCSNNPLSIKHSWQCIFVVVVQEHMLISA